MYLPHAGISRAHGTLALTVNWNKRIGKSKSKKLKNKWKYNKCVILCLFDNLSIGQSL